METADYSILPAFYRHRRIIKLSFNKLSALVVHTEASLAQHCPVPVVLYLEESLMDCPWNKARHHFDHQGFCLIQGSYGL